MCNIRAMDIDDYEAVYNIWMNTPGMGLNTIDDSREGIEKYLKRNPTTCFVAVCDEYVVGVIIAGHDGRRGYVYHTAVLMEYRNRGIAAKLVEAAMDALKAEGISKVALVAFAKNEIGNEFWEARDFSLRTDLNYRNKSLVEMKRIDT